jgi:hypothetical protein
LPAEINFEGCRLRRYAADEIFAVSSSAINTAIALPDPRAEGTILAVRATAA